MSRSSLKRAYATLPDEANRRDELVRCAARLFREKGYAATTVRDIAHAVGMRSGSPFYHFATKQDLLMAVMEQGLTEGLVRVREAVAAARTPVEQLRALVRTHLSVLLDEGHDFIAVMLYDWRLLEARQRNRLAVTKDQYDATWDAVLRELSRRGEIDADPKIARLLILGALNFTVTWYQASGPRSLDNLTEDMLRLVLKTGEARQ